MSKGRDRNVYRGTDGKWRNKRQDADRASSVHDTQREAYDAARDMLRRQGGGEISIHGEDGKVRDKNTMSPGNDPRSSRG